MVELINNVQNKIYLNEIGLFIQNIDLRGLHPSSRFSKEEKNRLRRFGAIFSDEDKKQWNDVIDDVLDNES